MNPEYTDKFLANVRDAGPADSPPPSDNQQVLYPLFDAIIKGDFDAMGQFLTDDVELNICGFPGLDGRWCGRDQVVAATRKNFGAVESQQPQIEGIISQGESTAVLIREGGVMKATRQEYSVRVVQWFTFEKGKVKKVEQITARI